jgi:hypothetical protein
VFRNSTGYNESIESLVATLTPSSIGIKEFVLMYVCDFSNNNSKIALLILSTSVFLGAIMMHYIRYMASLEWHR